jgi:hypothetical protein
LVLQCVIRIEIWETPTWLTKKVKLKKKKILKEKIGKIKRMETSIMAQDTLTETNHAVMVVKYGNRKRKYEEKISL